MSQPLRLRALSKHPAGGTIWLATWALDDPVWCVVHAPDRPSAALATVVAYAQEIPWRSDAPSRYAVGQAALAVEGASGETPSAGVPD